MTGIARGLHPPVEHSGLAACHKLKTEVLWCLEKRILPEHVLYVIS